MDRKVLLRNNKERLLCVNKEKAEYISVINVIGRGGTSIAYKARKQKNGKEEEWVIVKEYFPKKDYDSNIVYKRREDGGPIEIVVPNANISEDKQKEIIQAELERQNHLVERECNIICELRHQKGNNNPYIMGGQRIEFEEDKDAIGDTSYIVLDTQSGETLHSIIRENYGKLSFERAADYFEKLLEIITVLLEKDYCHCDIKPENLWIEGSGANQQMILIDFGSTFAYEDYKIDLRDSANVDRIMSLADSLMYDASVCSSTPGYSSPKLINYDIAKSEYMMAYDEEEKFEKALNLIGEIQKIDVSVDIYSALQILYMMLTGKVYGEDVKYLSNVKEETKGTLNAPAAKHLFKMMEENLKKGYHSVKEVEGEFRVLKKLQKNGAHPDVLLDRLKKEAIEMPIIDPQLLADISK